MSARRGLIAWMAATVLVTAACGSGESILVAGNDAPPSTPDVATTLAPAGTASTGTASTPTATPGTALTDNGPTTTIAGQEPVATPAPTAPPPPATSATTTTTPLDAFPDCPVDAIDAATEPIEITFWHALNATNEDAINRITDEYNAVQDRVEVRAENQGGYKEAIDKYFQSSQDSRPDVIMFPEYVVQRTVDSGSVIPIGACLEAAAYDRSVFQPSVLAAASTRGVQWGMPFNVSNPVLYYNRAMFEEAGLDPDAPPQSLEELRSVSQQIVDSGAAAYGLAIDSGTDSGGGWFIEQWLANAGQLYADNGNGRLAPATQVLYDGEAGVELLTFVQDLINDGLAYNVGDNAGGIDQFLRLANADEPAAMTIGTSAALGNIISAVEGGLIPDRTGADIGVGPLPGPVEPPTALVGGASMYVVADHGDERTAAVWDFIEYLISPEVQSLWATLTGYVPNRPDALEIEPVKSVYEQDPRFRVAYDQLVTDPTDLALRGPILGPQQQIRAVTAGEVARIFNGEDVQASLTAAADQADALITDYNARNN